MPATYSGKHAIDGVNASGSSSSGRRYNKGPVIALVLIGSASCVALVMISWGDETLALTPGMEAMRGDVSVAQDAPLAKVERSEQAELLEPTQRVPITDPTPEAREVPLESGKVIARELNHAKADTEELLEAVWRALEEMGETISAAADDPRRARLFEHPAPSPSYTIISSYPEVGDPYHVLIYRSEFPEYFKLLDERDRLWALPESR
jgi:hypothetical protein